METGSYLHGRFTVTVTVKDGVTSYNAVSEDGFGVTLVIPTNTPIRKRVSVVSRFNRIMDGLD